VQNYTKNGKEATQRGIEQKQPDKSKMKLPGRETQI